MDYFLVLLKLYDEITQVFKRHNNLQLNRANYSINIFNILQKSYQIKICLTQHLAYATVIFVVAQHFVNFFLELTMILQSTRCWVSPFRDYLHLVKFGKPG